MSVKSITPDEVVEKKQEQLPDFVVEAFNEMIAKNWNGRSASFKQDDVVNLICQKMGYEEYRAAVNKIYAEHWLDVEDVYRSAGWVVKYDKPAYNESYPATFEFSKKSKS